MRAAPACSVEPVEPKRVREEARDPAGEAVELRERVLAKRDEDVHRSGVASTVGSASAKEPGPRRRRIEEVLLGLIEHEIDIPVGLALFQRGDGRAVRPTPAASAERLCQRRRRIFAPAEKTTTSGSSGSSRSERATAARRQDDLPTPLGP